MSDLRLLCVDPAKVDAIWLHISGFLDAAYRRGGDDSIETLKADLDNHAALLWIVWDGKEIIAVAATKIVTTARKGRVCIIAALGGRRLRRWRHFIADLERYARAENCSAMRVMGRKGWAKVLGYGYRQPWVCLEKELN